MEQSDLDLLHTVPSYHLQAVIRARNITLSSKRRGSNATPDVPTPLSPSSGAEIASFLFDHDSIRAVIHELGEVEALILRELVLCGGRANSRDLALCLTYAGKLTSARKDMPLARETRVLDPPYAYQADSYAGMIVQYPPAHPHGVFEQALRRLLTLGLLFWGRQTNFASRDYSSGIHDGVLIVPVAVRMVAHSESQPEEGTLETHGVPELGEGVRRLQRSLYLYWSMVAAMRERLTLVNNGLLSRASLRYVIEYMRVKEPLAHTKLETDIPRLLFVRLLLLELGLLQERRGNLHAMPAEAFFELPLLERARHCCRLFVDRAFWNELLYLPEINVRPGPGLLDAAHEEVVRARQAVLERLTHESHGQWHALSAFVARTKLYVPYLLFPRQYGSRAERYSSGSNPYGWDFRLRRGWLTHREGWHMVEGGFIRALINGPLAWLGIVEVDQVEHPDAFRLSSGSAAIMSETPPAIEEAPEGRLIVQPNFELIALAPVSERLLVSLDRFAERVSLEHIAQYRLTRASVMPAIQHGIHTGAILAVLKQAAGADIPQNVVYSLTEWERQARRVEIWQGMILLEVADAQLLDTLFANEEIRTLFGRRLSSQIVEVIPQHLEAVQKLLWQRNYLPALTAAQEQDIQGERSLSATREPQWHLQEDGLLQPLYPVLDLYLKAEVERFSERDEGTNWQKVTPASLQRALDSGLTMDYVVRFLQHYCKAGIPGSLLIRIKLWGHGYGDQVSLQVEKGPLLRLPASILQDLRNDTRIQALLGAEVEQQSRLVRVEDGQLDQVLKLLRERGFSIE